MTTELTNAAQAALNACERIVDQEDSPVQFGIDFRSLGSSLRRALTTSRPAQAGADEVFLPRRLAATHKLTQLGYRYDHMQGQWLPTQPAAQATPAQDVGASADYWGDLAQQKADADARRGVSMPVSYYTSSIVGALLATQQAAPEPVGEVYGWAVTGLSFIWRGEHAQACAEQEAKTCGGTSIAFPLFTRPAPGVPEDVLSVCAKVADSPEVEEALCHYIKEESDTHTIAWLVEVILKQALAAAQAKGDAHE